MCGRFEAFTYEEVADIVAAVKKRAVTIELPQTETSRALVRPGSSVLLFGHGDSGNGLEITQSTWGFETGWNKRTVFNTRIESAIAGSGMWRDPAQSGRCIIPAASFYEPHATETALNSRTGRTQKRQYRFSAPDETPLLLAGVQAQGRCSVVTCPPNSWVAPVHDRMPLILRFEEVATWLSPAWPTLADRTSFALHVEPETPDAPDSAEQLTLF